MSQRILALEMPGDTVRAAVAERTWNSFHLIGVFEEERADDEPDLAAAVARLLIRTGTPDMVVSSLASELVVKRLLELPFSDARKLNQVVPFALEEHLPFPVDDAVVAFARVGRDRGNTLVMAAMARKPDLKRHLEVLSRAGLDPKEFDHCVFGNAQQTSGDALYGARHVALKAGLPIETPALTVNRLCGSGMQAILSAAQQNQPGAS